MTSTIFRESQPGATAAVSFTSSAPTPPAGLAAALVVVRLVIALLERLFADVGDLPPDHPERRQFTRVLAELARVEARILGVIAAAESCAVLCPQQTRAVRARRASPRPAAACVLRRAVDWTVGRALHVARAPPADRRSRCNEGRPASAGAVARP